MNVLEKILGEIEEKIKSAKKIIVKPPCDKLDEIANDTAEAFIEAYKECKEIIRSHMNNLQDAGAEEKSILCTVGEDGVLTPYDDTYDIVIHCSSKEDQERTIELIKSFNWIPISEGLPEKSGYYIASIYDDEDEEYRIEITWFHRKEDEDDESEWCELYDCQRVKAWQPLTEPYKGE